MKIDALLDQAAADQTDPRWRLHLTKPELATFDTEASYFARVTTTKGDILIRLFADTAPMHVTSFLYLSQLGFYDGLAFHRVIPGFMAQGGCPLGSGTGGPGYQFEGEFDSDRRHDRPGLLSMANAGPGTDGSQFFLTFVETPWLDGNHTIFGEVVEGKETLAALEALGSESGRPQENVKMERVTIEIR